ncbi:MAG: precorrin-3B C(17)-methyltransferase [Burkholderia sp.]|nr:precorrin-3B C(17)-methyltransferase [Burkholderia sp.]
MERIATPPAIIILSVSGLNTARRILERYPGAQIHGFSERVGSFVDVRFDLLSSHLCQLYTLAVPIIVLFSTGIVIRCLSSVITSNRIEPPVLSVAEDGSAIVPLLGGLTGVNMIAREIGEILNIHPAITTSGELRFGTCLLNPPEGYRLNNLAYGKRFLSDLLSGISTRIEGNAKWLNDMKLPFDENASHSIRITPYISDDTINVLVIHPISIVIAVATNDISSATSLTDHIYDLLKLYNLATQALAVIIAEKSYLTDSALINASKSIGVPLRFVDINTSSADINIDALMLLKAAIHVPYLIQYSSSQLACAITSQPIDLSKIGRARSSLTVVGLGPGNIKWLTPAARIALSAATDIIGYTAYVKMAGPFRVDQKVHCTDNRKEIQRAYNAFKLAAAGQQVVVVSSGDAGVFAMAAAVLEVLDRKRDPNWEAIELRIEPGVSAAFATAALAGAPLGNDFCIISLSDNLKPWSVINKRLQHAVNADLVIALYNPISSARPWQLECALDTIRKYRGANTIIILGRQIGRLGETLIYTTLGSIRLDQVDMRTTVIVGSTTTRHFRIAGRDWVYTPRWCR